MASDTRKRYEERMGPWPDLLDPLIDAGGELASAAVDYMRVPFARGHLDAKLRQFILIAVNASTTHLYEPALRIHIRNALALGATPEEIIEVYELTSVLGIHTCTMGIPVLASELADAGIKVSENLDAYRKEIKDKFLSSRGAWTPFLEQMLILDPELLEAYEQYSTVPWKRGLISPKHKELIYIAIDSQPTHLYETGLRVHIRNALKQGATCDEIIDVFALVSSVGLHSLTMGLPILQEEVGRCSE